MKKLFIMASIIVSLLTSSVFASEGVLSIDKVTYDNGRITVSGKGSSAASSITMKITDEEIVKNYFAIDETLTDKKGEYTFEVNLPADADAPADGKLTLRVQESTASEPEKQQTVYYAKKTVRDELIKKLKAADLGENPTEVTEQVLNNPDYRAGLFTLGVDMDAYESNPSLKTSAVKIFTESNDVNALDESGIKSALNKSIYIGAVNSGMNVKDILTKMNPVYGGKEFKSAGAELENKIESVISAGKPFDSEKAFDDSYARGNIFYAAKHARTTEIGNIIAEAAKYGLNKETYDKYNGIGDKSGVNDKIVTLLDEKEISAMTDLEDVIKSALPKSGGNSGGNSGGSSSRGGGSSSRGGSSRTIGVSKDYVNSINENKMQFNDLDDAEWAKEAINVLASRQIVNGFGNSEFGPNREVTREEFVKILANACDISAETDKISFEDVPSDAWFYPYVMACTEKGIIRGIDSGRFGTGEKLTRQDMATIVYRAAQYKNIDLQSTREYREFSDGGSISGYAKEAIEKLYSAEKINGVSVSLFEPSSYCTRAQAAKLIYDVFIK